MKHFIAYYLRYLFHVAYFNEENATMKVLDSGDAAVLVSLAYFFVQVVTFKRCELKWR